ncbi:MAG: GDSL-type esterase/lipase family protein [Candidatus Muiribacteriota bacterium]
MKTNIIRKIVVLLAGVLFSILILETGLRLSSSYYQPDVNVSKKTPKDKIIISCFGDSYTYGMGVARENSYPSQLQKKLGDNFIVYNYGKPGSNTFNVYNIMKEAFKKNTPDTALILAGTNNTWNYDGYERKKKNFIIRFLNNLKIYDLYNFLMDFFSNKKSAAQILKLDYSAGNFAGIFYAQNSNQIQNILSRAKEEKKAKNMDNYINKLYEAHSIDYNHPETNLLLFDYYANHNPDEITSKEIFLLYFLKAVDFDMNSKNLFLTSENNHLYKTFEKKLREYHNAEEINNIKETIIYYAKKRMLVLDDYNNFEFLLSLIKQSMHKDFFYESFLAKLPHISGKYFEISINHILKNAETPFSIVYYLNENFKRFNSKKQTKIIQTLKNNFKNNHNLKKNNLQKYFTLFFIYEIFLQKYDLRRATVEINQIYKFERSKSFEDKEIFSYLYTKILNELEKHDSFPHKNINILIDFNEKIMVYEKDLSRMLALFKKFYENGDKHLFNYIIQLFSKQVEKDFNIINHYKPWFEGLKEKKEESLQLNHILAFIYLKLSYSNPDYIDRADYYMKKAIQIDSDDPRLTIIKNQISKEMGKKNDIDKKFLDEWIINDYKKIVDLCREFNVTPVIINYPFGLNPEYFSSDLLKNTAHELEVNFINLKKYFNSFDNKKYEGLFLQDRHLNAEGNRLMADYIREYLK